MSFTSATIVVLALCLATSGPAAVAAPMLAVSFDDTPGTLRSSNVTIGWRFTTASPIRVSQLGFWDMFSDGLGESHQVGIWTTAGAAATAGTPGAALVSGTVAEGTTSPLAAGTRFRMVDIVPTDLPAGDYVIGGFLAGSLVDSYREGAANTFSNFADAPGITYVERRYGIIGGTNRFARPDGSDSGLGAFGPNFTFEVVPEPSSAAVLAVGLAGLGLRRRKQSR